MKRGKKNAAFTPNSTAASAVVRVHAVIHSRRLFKRGQTVVVGVSAGADSVTLLHILWELRYELGISIIVAHFNHCLRPEAHADEQFVARLAQQLQLPFVSGRPQQPHTHGSLEEWAREERFRFLCEAARTKKSSVVALAHTEDDLAETVLMRILRGTGLMGLRGILHERSFDGGIRLVRPLLGLAKSDLLTYLKSRGLSFRLDRTNLKTDFFRNKIRLRLMPLLRDGYNPNIRHVLSDLSQQVSDDYDFIDEKAGAVFARAAKTRERSLLIESKIVAAAHVALRRMVFRRAYASIKGDLKQLTLDHIHEIQDLLDRRPVGAIVHLPAGIRVIKRKIFLEFSRA